ncbi:hypothetical protein CpipJ_CPIJ008259 [Culex quinquefasciatus]|uniref:RING-type domain-containing protein n=1 Tax=Culex quinquefasciatus TaxID=7176 RepID=B0WLQ1_CULQU|nr:hypothetical protein CpipJ_CPIJ008259 [Culex quinquefasciatus]|eukprot:XP_001849635.1 hypothetical protein CpipJ_CPIJ008259 [Culex quinquefasciatus]
MSLQAIFGVVTSLVVGVAVAFGIYAVVSQTQNRPHQYPPGGSGSGRSQPTRPSGGGRRSSRAKATGSQWQGYSSDDDVVCSICMEKIEEEAGADSRPIKLRCGHLFHDNCIAPWVPNQKCPNCREQM